jgi:hypothetical protein
MKGQPRAIVMTYACHADVVCQNYAISADYPGAATQKVKELLCRKPVNRRPSWLVL